MAAVVRTEHPHIVMSPGVAGATPIIAGTRISVALIVGLLRAGDTPQDILATYPHLAPAAVYDAISYYYDHQDDIDGFIRDNTLEAHAARSGFSVGDDGRLSFKHRGDRTSARRLRGLHRDVWEGVGADDYIRREREAWDG